jgi:hypothetical protein
MTNGKHTPKPVCEHEDVTVMEPRGTYKEVTADRPDIIIINKKEKTCILTDGATPVDRNVMQKETEKKRKYNSLRIQIQRMWNT